MKIVKVDWLIVSRSGQAVCTEKTLWKAIRTKDAVPGSEIKIQVTEIEVRDPSNAEMAKELGLPEWADAVSGGGN